MAYAVSSACPDSGKETYAERIRRLVDEDPPFTFAELEQIAAILGLVSVAPSELAA
jgi:hypothetical protein